MISCNLSFADELAITGHWDIAQITINFYRYITGDRREIIVQMMSKKKSDSDRSYTQKTFEYRGAHERS